MHRSLAIFSPLFTCFLVDIRVCNLLNDISLYKCQPMNGKAKEDTEKPNFRCWCRYLYAWSCNHISQFRTHLQEIFVPSFTQSIMDNCVRDVLSPVIDTNPQLYKFLYEKSLWWDHVQVNQRGEVEIQYVYNKYEDEYMWNMFNIWFRTMNNVKITNIFEERT